MVVVAAGSAPVGSPPGWARSPDPQCGRRVCIRPQPMRAPRGEVMALGPSWRVGSARAVAGPPLWRGAVAGRHGTKPPRRCGCPLRWAQPGTCPGHNPPPPPPPKRTVTTGRADRARRLTGDWLGWAPRSPPPPPLQPQPRPCFNVPWPPCQLPPVFFAYGTWTERTWTRTRPGARASARPPPPLTWYQGRHHGLALLRWWYR